MLTRCIVVLLLSVATQAAAAPMSSPRCTTLAKRAQPRVAVFGAPGCHEGRAVEPSVSSLLHPITVHHVAGQEALAAQAITVLDEAWVTQIDQMGWDPPLPDGGACGSDNVDFFLETGSEEAYTLDATPDLTTPHDDYSAYVVIDAVAFGEEYFAPTLAHEFNHVLQAAHDWWEIASVFEMSASYVETLAYPLPDFTDYVLTDFINQPQLPVDTSDDFETFFMYGAAEYLLFLDGACFPDDATFLARAWRGARSPAQEGEDPSLNEPDVEDGLDAVLAECGTTYLDSIASFRQAAWQVGPGSEITQAADWDPMTTRPRVANEIAADSLDPLTIQVEAGGLGASYTRITWAPALAAEVQDFEVSPSEGWAAAVVEDDRAAGVLVVVAWPAIDSWDADASEPSLRPGEIEVNPIDPGDDGEEGGCGCGVPGRRQSGSVLLVALSIALASARRRLRSTRLG